MCISGSKSVKKGQKMLKKSHKLDFSLVFQIFFGLAHMIHIDSYNMRKKVWCHIISLGLNFSHFLILKCPFLFYYPELPRPSKKKSYIFLPKKSLGIVYMLPVFSRKKLILCSKMSKNFRKIDAKLPLLVPKIF